MSFVANWKTHQFDSSLLVHTLYTPRYCSRWLFLNLSFSTLHHFRLETRLSTTRRALSLWVQLGRLDDKFSWQTFHRQLAIIQPFFERTFHRELADNLMDFSAFWVAVVAAMTVCFFTIFQSSKCVFSPPNPVEMKGKYFDWFSKSGGARRVYFRKQKKKARKEKVHGNNEKLREMTGTMMAIWRRIEWATRFL